MSSVQQLHKPLTDTTKCKRLWISESALFFFPHDGHWLTSQPGDLPSSGRPSTCFPRARHSLSSGTQKAESDECQAYTVNKPGGNNNWQRKIRGKRKYFFGILVVQNYC